jgi:hypothetical protein
MKMSHRFGLLMKPAPSSIAKDDAEKRARARHASVDGIAARTGTRALR